MDQRTKLIHPVWWVGLDRHKDEHLRRDTLPRMRRDGYDLATPEQVRVACAQARARGFEVLPHRWTSTDGVEHHVRTAPIVEEPLPGAQVVGADDGPAARVERVIPATCGACVYCYRERAPDGQPRIVCWPTMVQADRDALALIDTSQPPPVDCPRSDVQAARRIAVPTPAPGDKDDE